jgi:hypothetical protein
VFLAFSTDQLETCSVIPNKRAPTRVMKELFQHQHGAMILYDICRSSTLRCGLVSYSLYKRIWSVYTLFYDWPSDLFRSLGTKRRSGEICWGMCCASSVRRSAGWIVPHVEAEVQNVATRIIHECVCTTTKLLSYLNTHCNRHSFHREASGIHVHGTRTCSCGLACALGAEKLCPSQHEDNHPRVQSPI